VGKGAVEAKRYPATAETESAELANGHGALAGAAAMKRLLVLSHGHPTYSKGGGEHAAYALHQAIGALQGWQSLFVAAAPDHKPLESNLIESLSLDPSSCLVPSTPDWLLFDSAINLGDASALKRLVLDWQPDVIHAHHFHRLGLDLVLRLRHWCSSARLVFTLHEFLMLCPYQGQLFTRDGGLCAGPSLKECSDCLPQLDPIDLEMRDGLMRSLLRSVDVFVSPSRFLADRFQAWSGGDCDVRVVHNCPPPLKFSGDSSLRLCQDELPCRFGIFGNLASISKGLDLVLQAFLEVLNDVPMASLMVGGELPKPGEARSPAEYRYLRNLWQLIFQLGSAIELVGPYTQSEIPVLMSSLHWVVMGSRWFENAPVVIQEAKICRRPLIVPGHGGMAELVKEGVDGWYVVPGDVTDFSKRMIACCNDPGRWNSMVANMNGASDRRDVINSHLEIYALPG
jgi:glycosyltransferase involved in cell wall biosynthesis